MAKVILICGKICSGKTYYCNNLIKENNAIILSSDELISDLFHPNENDYHDMIVKRVHNFLTKKAIEIIKAGTNVILDWGFWTKQNREEVTKLFASENIYVEWYFIDVSDEHWKRNINLRNKAVEAGKTHDYYIDEGLLNKVNSLFEPPAKDEIDVWYKA